MVPPWFTEGLADLSFSALGAEGYSPTASPVTGLGGGNSEPQGFGKGSHGGKAEALLKMSHQFPAAGLPRVRPGSPCAYTSCQIKQETENWNDTQSRGKQGREKTGHRTEGFWLQRKQTVVCLGAYS